MAAIARSNVLALLVCNLNCGVQLKHVTPAALRSRLAHVLVAMVAAQTGATNNLTQIARHRVETALSARMKHASREASHLLAHL
jgi:hypothetical protein